MPLWGRPAGARQGKFRNARDKNVREQVDRRLQEIDSDAEDGEGVGLDQSYFMDEPYVTGATPISRLRNRRVRINDYASERSEDEDDSDDGIGGMQLVLRDKEDRLARKALERIRSAQVLGIKNVMLTESEYDALESRKKRDPATIMAAAPNFRTKGRRGNGVQLTEHARGQSGSGKRMRTSVPNYDNEELPHPEVATPPGFLVPGPSGGLSFRPFPNSAVPQSPLYRSTRSRSRSTSSHGQQPIKPTLRSSQYYQPDVGYPLTQGASRLPARVQPVRVSHNLPDDPNWTSRPRSASSQTYSPPLSQERPFYAQGQRNLSGPTDIHSIDSRRGHLPPMPLTSSEPSLSHRAHHTPLNSDYLTDNDDENEDEDESYGVQLNMAPYNQDYGVLDDREDYRRDRRRRSER